jgi:hypothetical protein
MRTTFQELFLVAENLGWAEYIDKIAQFFVAMSSLNCQGIRKCHCQHWIYESTNLWVVGQQDLLDRMSVLCSHKQQHSKLLDHHQKSQILSKFFAS